MTAEAERDGGAGPVWHVTDADFSRQVLASPKLVLVDFWAPWCKPCLELNPIVEELAIAYQGRAVFAKLNIDENPQAAKEYQIQGVPTLLFFRSGQVAERIEGLGSKSELSVTLDSLLTR
jgi:thioredoxin 1